MIKTGGYLHYEQAWIAQQERVLEYSRINQVPIFFQSPSDGDVQLVDVIDGRPIYYTNTNTNAAASTRTDELWPGGATGLNLTGSGYADLAVWDGGKVRTTHQEFNQTGNARVIQNDGATSISNHATHVAGTIVARGVVANAKGMAYEATLQVYDWSNDESEMATAAANGLEVSNHSYGFAHGWSNGSWTGDPNISTQEDYWFGFYTYYTREWDEIAYNAPYYLIVKSAGNDRNDSGPGPYPADGNAGTGYDCIGTKATAKNILTVGAANDVTNYMGPSSVSISSFSSWGPIDDGRIKPDIVVNGVSLYSSLGGSNTNYGSYRGTSMSSPNASGTLALLQDYYQSLHNGTAMRASTLKALVINTADEAGTTPSPDYIFG